MNPLSSDPLRQAEQAIHDGKIQEARAMLIDYIKRDPNYDRAWWLLTFTLTDLSQQVDCLKRVLNLNPAHSQAREWLANLKKTGSLPPLKPTVNPFVTGSLSGMPDEKPKPPVFSSRTEKPVPVATSMWPAPEHESYSSVEETLFPNGQTFNSAPVTVTPPPDTTPPAWTLPEDEKPEPPEPGKQAKDSTPPGKKQRMKNTWIIDAIIISAILCVAITVGIIYWLNQQTKFMLSDLQQTVESVSIPTDTFMPSWTRTSTHTPVPSNTSTETSTLTPTLEFTLTATPIPENMFGPVVSLYPPDFTLTDAMTGKQVTLSDYRGQPVLIFFWASWCPYCKAEIPELQAVYERYKEDGLVVLAVNSGEDASTVSSFGLNHVLTFPLLLNSDQEVDAAYGVDTLPRHFFVGRNGRISLIEYGAMDSGALDWQVKILVKKYPTQTINP